MAIPEYTASCPDGVYQSILTMQGDRPGDLAREMEKITEEHLGTLGMSRGELKAAGLIWVIAWTEITVQRMPWTGEKVVLRIWPGKKKTMMHTRRYAFYTTDGEPLACAASLFVLMDANTRGFAEGAPDRECPVVVLPNEPTLPKMRVPFPEELSERMMRTVVPEEIDLNGHLNNTHYLDWGDELNEGAKPHTIWIQYVKELMEGQTATLYYQREDSSLYVRGTTAEGEAFLLAEQF